MVRFKSCVLVLDFAHLDLVVSVKSMALLGLAISVGSSVDATRVQGAKGSDVSALGVGQRREELLNRDVSEDVFDENLGV